MSSYNKILVISTVCFLVIFSLGFLGFSSILKFVVRDQTALKKRNLIKKIYLKLPFPMTLNVYFFNITNPESVQEGATPVLQEVGPYVYDAWKEKIEVLENAGEDSLSYTPYETYFFNPTFSGALSENDYVTVLHPLIVGIVNTVAKDSPPLLPIVDKALNSIFSKPKNMYLTTKVRDFLFDGMTINCSVQDFAAKAVCSQIKSQVPGLTEPQRNVYKFSIFGPRNGTLPNRFKILRGIKKSPELGRVVELNHEKELNVWTTKRCNRFRGSDGWIFPPFVNKENGIWIFVVDLCKSVRLFYVNDTKYSGISVERYNADLGDMSSNPEDKCYCPSPKTCLPKGVFDLTKCMGVPLYATLPHFLRVDENVQKGIKGLNPDADKHVIEVLMQPLLGIPLSGRRRVQFNLQLKPVSKIGLMAKIPTTLHPIFWLEEGIDIEGPLLQMMKIVFTGLSVFGFVKYVLLTASLAGMGVGGYLHYKERKMVQVTPLQDLKTSAKSRSISYIIPPEVEKIEERVHVEKM